MKLLTGLLASLIIAGYSLSAAAQVNCGSRFMDSTFTSVAMGTVQYGANRNLFGLNQNLMADVYQPVNDPSASRPLVIILFGGTFFTGSRADAGIVYTAHTLAKYGYVTAAIDYRLGFTSLDSVQTARAVYRSVQDAKAAVRYFRNNGAQPYKIDTSQIYLLGFSAGAITSQLSAYWQQNEVPGWLDTTGLGTLENKGGTPGVSSRVSGILAFAGAMGDTSWINNENVPTAMVHNSTDPIVPYNYGPTSLNLHVFGSYAINRKLQHRGKNTSLKTLNSPNMHVPDMHTPEGDTAFAFFVTALRGMACNAVTAVASKTSVRAVSVYPNPVPGNEFNILVPEGERLNSWELYTGNGKLVQTGSTTQVSLEQNTPGIYLLRVNTGGVFHTLRVVKR